MTSKATNVSEIATQMRVYAIGLRGENDLKVGPHMAAQMLEDGAFAIDNLLATYLPLSPSLEVERLEYRTGVCHLCGYDNADRDWPLRIDNGVRGTLEAASRLINQMDRDKGWISQDVSAVLGQIAEALSALPLLEDRRE